MSQDESCRLSDLQELLKEERDRCNQYKHIYQTLKEKYSKLEKELQAIHDQLKSENAKNEALKSTKETNLLKLETKIKDLQSENYALNNQVKSLDARKIHDAAVEESSKHYEAKIRTLHSEMDSLRELYNEMRYENAVLKCKFESRESEFTRSLERINIEHSNQTEELLAKLDSLQKSNPDLPDKFALELKDCKRDLVNTNSKIKILESECEELRAQNEDLTLQLNSANRSNAKQLADSLSNLRILESDKQKIQMEKDILEKESANAMEHRKVVTSDLHSTRKKVLQLKSKVEKREHQYQLLITDHQVERERWKAKQTSLQETFQAEVEKLNAQIQLANDNFTKEQNATVEKEQDLLHQLTSAKQNLWKQSRNMNLENERLEKKLEQSESEQQRLIQKFSQNIQTLEQKLQDCIFAKAEVEKEFSIFREKKHSHEVVETENYVSSGPNYGKEIDELKRKIDTLAASALSNHKERSYETNKRQNEDSSREAEIIKMKLDWEQQKLHFRQRLDELESQLREVKSSAVEEKRELEIAVKNYSKQVTKLKEKLETKKSQHNDMVSQMEIYKKYVPPDIHNQVKYQLSNMQQVLAHFRMLVSSDPREVDKAFPLVPEKHLIDIQNIDFTNSPTKSSIEKQTQKISVSTFSDNLSNQRLLQPRRKSLKQRNLKLQQKLNNALVTSSSDSDLENL